MRYILKRDFAQDWGIWDTRKQMFFAQGLGVEEARITVDKKNKRNNRRVKKIIGEKLPK